MIMGLVTGDRVNGAARWMTFFGIQFQPSELAKMAVVIVTARLLSKFQDENGYPQSLPMDYVLHHWGFFPHCT